MIEIRILTGARAGQTDRFDKPVIVVGRHATVDLRFSPEKDLDVSGRHAEIREADGRRTITDLGSTNGSRVNGVTVQEVVLGPGDRIQLGDTVLVVDTVSQA